MAPLQTEPTATTTGSSQPSPDDTPVPAGLPAVVEMITRSRALGYAPSDEAVLERAADIARDVLGYRSCTVALCQAEGNLRCWQVGARPAPDGPENGPGARPGWGGVLDGEHENREMIISASAYQELCERAEGIEGAFWLPPGRPRPVPGPAPAGAAPVLDAAATLGELGLFWAPVLGEDGRQLGFVSPGCATETPPAPSEALLLVALAGLVHLGLELRRVEAAKRRAASVADAQRRQLEDLIAASLEVRGNSALEDVLSGIARAMASGVGFGRAAVWLLESRLGEPSVRLGRGVEPARDSSLKEIEISLAATVGISVAEAGRLSSAWGSLAQFAPVLRPEMRVSRSYLLDHRYFEEPAALVDIMLPAPDNEQWDEGTWHGEDSLTVPLEDREGNLLGLISMDEPLNRALPTREDCRCLEFFADQCALAVVESRRLEAALEEATTDDLTGLANRRGLLERADLVVLSTRRSGSTCSALYIDIDHFKDINDSFGHSTGDEVIASVGRTISHRLRRGDLIGRYGGEEFVVLLPNTNLEEATALAETIKELVAATEPIVVNPPLYLHVSVGVASLQPGDDMQSLLNAADAALYQAKRSGRNRVCVASS
ncbi:MAG TPA: GGDEF domain-containing protein [Acidimicrobiales bacterium]|nr:GGDEF domain-containing protein [Acidimicrobiales bacterium]